jgi:hypothetical protein
MNRADDVHNNRDREWLAGPYVEQTDGGGLEGTTAFGLSDIGLIKLYLV